MDSHAFKVIEKKRLADHIDRGAKNMEQLLNEDGCGHNTATKQQAEHQQAHTETYAACTSSATQSFPKTSTSSQTLLQSP